MQSTEFAQAAPLFAGVDLHLLAAAEGTPLHVYSEAAIRTRMAGLREALRDLDALVGYAVKANSNRAILELLAAEGAGADIVSGGELWRSLRAGIPAERIVFSGVGKSAAVVGQRLGVGAARSTVESRAALDQLQAIAAQRSTIARAAVRTNPGVDALTHAKIYIVKAQIKFGLSIT